jgi:cyclopropane-fatty-acyl-phospholipid synthase
MNEFIGPRIGQSASGAADAAGFLDRLFRRSIIAGLAGLRGGQIVFEDALGRVAVGERTSDARALCVTVRIRDLRAYRAIASGGSIGAAESYRDGEWHCDDLVALVRLLVRNRDLLDGMERGLARLSSLALRGWRMLRRNTHRGSRGNIAAHYDLGNEFFGLFLSSDLMYSAALWTGEDDSLEQASARKLDAVCRKLSLKSTDRVIEIGTGWGGFAIHAARQVGCHVTTATISREQFALAKERVAAAGLGDRIEVLLRDYRNLEGRFDKLVSIEMIEAVGPQYLGTFFAKAAELLRPEGLALIQAITIEDHRYEQALRAVDFIQRHVFPGSFIPSLFAILEAKTRVCDLALIEAVDFGPSYGRTLAAWRARFQAQLPAVRALGFDDRFIRLWDYYLAYCEGGFRERSIGVAHLLFSKPPRYSASSTFA